MEKKTKIIGIVAVVLVIAAVGLLLPLFNRKYEVTFMNDNKVLEVVKVSKNSMVTKPTEPKRDGYTFSGWYLDDELFDFTTKLSEDVTLVAKWEIIVEDDTDEEMVTVSFDSDGGTFVEEQIVHINSIIKKPVSPEKEGYTFIGWELDSESFDFATKVTKNITLKAKWSKNQTTETKKVTYKVRFETNGGSTVKTQTVTSGKTASKPSNPVKSGYKFIGWYYNGNLYNFNLKITKNIVLTAKWQKNSEDVAEKYTVTFNTEGGSTIASQTVESGKTASKPNDPVKDGYTFKGWYYENTKYDFATKVTKNIVLTAKWESNTGEEVATKYTVTFNTEGGSTIESQTVESGKTASKPNNPVKDGYTFQGWYYENTKYDFATKVTKNIVLTAKWEKTAKVTAKIEADEDSYVGQAKIFVYKGDVKVAGIVDITTSSGTVIENVEIPVDGYPTNIYKVTNISNVRVK